MSQSLPPSSDDCLRWAILALFSTKSVIASAGLRVGVSNGIVHLTGRVNSMEIRDQAEELAKNVCGVRGVVNRIEAPGAPNPARRIDLTQ